MNIRQLATRIQSDSGAIIDRLNNDAHWFFPVGTPDHPPERWYAASLHDLTGRRNDGYCHSGLDLNLDLSPWGDVDRGMPVWSVTGATVTQRSYSSKYLGSIILLIDYEGVNLWTRYWHLADDEIFWSLDVGDYVDGGWQVGSIGNYTLGGGGDHLHFDMALDSIGPHWWFTSHPQVRWIDPAFILETRLDPDIVSAMLERMT